MTTQTSFVQPSVAIIGMGGMFANSRNLKEYWRNLLKGIDCITEPPASHARLKDYFDRDPKKPDHIYCNRGGFLPTTAFDPTEFGIPPAALEATDTSQLLGLVAAKMALADAGYGDGREFDREHTSVILGVTGTQELVISLGSRLGHPFWRRALENKGLSEKQKTDIIAEIADSYVSWQENSFPGLLGNVVAGRICNRLNLGGTNCVVDAACASSLSAVHLALMELNTGKSDMVVTGGVDTINDIFMHMCFSKTGVLSHSGDARPFSADADGTVLGEGIGLLVLKRLDAAERDGDRIYAVIRGIGSSSDGKSQSIYAPRAEGQARALTEAYRNAGIAPEVVDLVEAHGTGTRVGDQVEFTALKSVFGAVNPNGNRCALGTVKSMIGHTKAAAGAAGIIKSALALHNKVLPPTLKADRPDPHLGIESSPFYLNTSARPWFTREDRPRRCGVSSFGFGGSNFHVVIEEYRHAKNEIAWDGSVELLAFSGSHADRLVGDLTRMIGQLENHAEAGFPHRAAKALRTRFSAADAHRLILVADTTRSAGELTAQLQSAVAAVADGHPTRRTAEGIYYGTPDRSPGKLAFMFPGQGSQYVNMGRELACTFPTAMQAIEAAAAHYDPAPPLWELLFPRPALTDAERDRQEDDLRRTDAAQPAIGAVSLAMLSILDYFNLHPDATCGHSYGELPALYAAGWIDRATLLDLSVTRGRLMAAAGSDGDAGTMLAVKAPPRALQALVAKIPGVVLANANSPEQGVLSGTRDAILSARAACDAEGYRCVDLPVAAAFHSPLIAAAGKPFCDAVAQAAFTPTRVPVYADATAAPYPVDPSRAADLLSRQMTSSVQFQGIVEHLFEAGVRTFVEVGPKAVLSGLVRATLKNEEMAVIALDPSAGKTAGILDLGHAIGQLAALGLPVDLKRWESEPPAHRPQKMAVPLSGTNYRTPRQSKTTAAAEKAAAPEKPVRAATPPTHDRAMDSPPEKTDPLSPSTPPVKSMKTPSPQQPSGLGAPPQPAAGADMNAALVLVHQGLESIQALQQQTAQAHQKFLDTQAQAGRTLQEMMNSMRMLVGSVAGIGPAPALDQRAPTVNAADTATPPPPTALAEPPAQPPAPVPPVADTQTRVNETTIPQRPTATNGPETPGTTEAADDVARSLIAIVAELTGYPREMLGLDMDIEADLGIDSIKRVEILSAMEERLPHLPAVTPDMVGTLKTLGQICDFLGADSQSASGAAPAATYPDEAAAEDSTTIEDTLLAVVAELTGYPREMLGLDMDIEADLGIDSIKRVEILSAMEERLPHLPAVTPDMVGTLKTLGQICGYLDGTAATAAVARRVVEVVDAAKMPGRALRIEAGRWIGIVADQEAVAMAVAGHLERNRIDARIIPVDEVGQAERFMGSAGVILSASTPPECAFIAARNAAAALRDASMNGDALFAGITGLDGAFGFTGNAFDAPDQAALAGLVKTAALEWESVICRAIDLGPGFADADAAAAQVVAELLTVDDNDPVEIGLLPDRRVILTTVPAEISAGSIHLGKDDVVVVTGGGRGVTAACAIALARASGAAIALIGRSAPPFDIPTWLHGIDDEAAMKTAIAANAFGDTRPTPKDLESLYRRHAANRDIHRTLKALGAEGVNAAYFSADVTDRESLAAAFDTIRRQMGPVSGLIHGAGVLQDRRIADKSVDQFRRVYDTKVEGLSNLLAVTREDELGHLVLFSSVSARTGNIGQCDYAMANEVLNKMARVESSRRNGCRVTAINWGPWDGGMVTPALKKALAGKDIRLIPLETGARLLVAEMQNPGPGPVEVLIGDLLPAVASPAGQSADAPLAMLERREVDLQRYPVLASHIIGGKPVVPLALISEWIGHGALKENPGFSLHGIDDLRLLSGIRLEEERKLVRLMAGKARKTGNGWQVDVELRNGMKNGRDVIHSRARALLVDRFPDAPIFTGNGKNGDRTYPRDIEAVYGQILFHGAHLRAIQAIEGYSDHGMTARLANAPKPEAWMQDPIRERWMADPMVLDGAFQMAIVWCFEQSGRVCLPSYARAYRQYRPTFPSTGITAVMTVTAHGPRKMAADFTFLDDHFQVVATLTGFEATVDESLGHAFKNNGLASDITENFQ